MEETSVNQGESSGRNRENSNDNFTKRVLSLDLGDNEVDVVNESSMTSKVEDVSINDDKFSSKTIVLHE